MRRLLPLLLLATVARAESFDLIIRRASVIDGTGTPAYPGDLAIRGDRIAAVGQLPAGATAVTEIDAAGRVVAPGFILNSAVEGSNFEGKCSTERLWHRRRRRR